MISLKKANRLSGEITVPGDKSISHRAVMFGALAKGTTEITGFLNGADCLSTIDCFRRLGVEIELEDAAGAQTGSSAAITAAQADSRSPFTDGTVQMRRQTQAAPRVLVHGRGLRGLAPADGAQTARLYTGNSGTTTRIISGILAPQPFTTILSGDASINRRPMKRVIEPLSQMGADIVSENGDGCAPLRITGAPLHGIAYRSPVASAQVKSAILCAGLYADGETTVLEPTLSRDHTERMLTAFGAQVRTTFPDAANTRTLAEAQAPLPASMRNPLSAAQAANVGRAAEAANLSDGAAQITISPCDELYAQAVQVPGDISSAAYFLAAALLVPGSEVLIRGVGTNPTRAGILVAAKAMGADITFLNEKRTAEPTADLLVRAGALHGAVIEGALIPTLIDELPIIAVMAAAADGETVIRNAAELKVKESDRIAVVTENLRAMGADITPTDDGFVIRGGRPLHGALINPHLDHRIAMSFAVAALIADGETTIRDEDCVAISYPTFFADLERLRDGK